MAKPLILLTLKEKNEFINDSEYIKYCKRRYIQKCNYEYRLRQKYNISIGDICSLLSN